MKHSINISVINNAAGVAPSSDGVMMLICKAVAVSGTFVLDTAYLLTKLADLTALGIDADYDTSNSTAVYQQVSEFYDQAGDGALCWLVGTAKANSYATYVAGSVFAGLIRYTAQADPANRAKMIGFCYDVPSETQSSADFPSDVLATITALQTAQEQLFALGYQFSAIIDGYNMSTSVTPSSLGTMATKSAPSVSMCITGTKGNGVSAVGLALGRFARISIGHGFGAVEDGPVDTPTAFLTNSIIVLPAGTLVVGDTYTVYGGTVTYNGTTYQTGQSFTAIESHTSYTTADTGYVIDNATPVEGLDPTDIDSLGTKQYMFLRTWFNHSGFFWNDGATCEDPTLQLSTQEYNRVANALSADALSFFIDEMGKNLPLDTKTGNADPGYLSSKQAEFYSTYIAPLSVASGSGDLSDAELILSAPNFNSTKTMNFILNIVPTPILGDVAGTIEFTSTL